MLSALPDHDTLYDSLLARDPHYDGRVFVGVSTTGVFCRLTCPARKPNPDNCRFFTSAADCLGAGFRPCRRCHPLRSGTEDDPLVTRLLTALEEQRDRRWSETDLAALGFDPSTVRRRFKRHFGVTLLELSRMSRIGAGFETLSRNGRVIEAQLDAGFDSSSAFRAAFARLLGQAPSRFTGNELLRADWIETPLGAMVAVCDSTALHLLEFVDRKALPAELRRLQAVTKGRTGLGRYDVTDRVERELQDYFQGRGGAFTVPLALHGSPFTKSVWQAVRQIPPGQTRSYGEIARALDRPTAVRAVARANGANQIALVIPCHRVIGADGSLTGYGGGIWRKRKLIEMERQNAAAASPDSRPANP